MNEDNTELDIKLAKDMKVAAGTMNRTQARLLVDSYYQMQDNRLRASGQIRSMDEEPHAVLDWLEKTSTAVENQIKGALTYYAEDQPMGKWALGVVGIGPVIAAGLLAHIDIEKAPTAGHIWRFAGMDPTVKWGKGEKRPWNAGLKVICWKAWQSWLKLKNNESCTYAKLLFQRREYEWKRNLAGGNAEAAAKGLEKKLGKDSGARAWYEGRVNPEWATEILSSGKPFPMTMPKGMTGIPMLPPAQILNRAGRWTVKLFLSHWHGEAYRNHFGKEPPLPYPIAHLGHAHVI